MTDFEKKNIFILDDDETFISDLKIILRKKYNVFSATTIESTLTNLKKLFIDYFILDINLGNKKTGLDVIEEILQIDPFLPIIVLSYHEEPQIIIEAIKKGAVDYIHKSEAIEEIEKFLEISTDKISRIKQYHKEEYTVDKIICKSSKMQKIYDDLMQIAKTKVSVLLTGESGVGKSFFAKIIHDNSSKNGNFVTVHIPSISTSLFESEFFGYEKGAFTGALKNKIGKIEFANDGTVFLDEITETSLDNQAKLLRLVESKEYERVGSVKTQKTNARFIAASNKDLLKLVKEGKFREDLYYRISSFPIFIPPLREHKEDIIPFAEFALIRYSKSFNKNIVGFSKTAINKLLSYDFPGNIRELFHIVERCVLLLKNGNVISEDLLFQGLNKTTNECSEKITLPYHVALKNNNESFQREYVKKLLQETNGRIGKAADIAQISRQSLTRILKKM